jgi:hypothetical protein
VRGRQRDDAHHLQAALLEVREALRAAEVADRIRQPAQTIYQALIELELTAVIGAAPNERTDARSAHRNGHRDRLPTTTAGDLELRMPKLRMARSSRRCSSAAAGSTRPCLNRPGMRGDSIAWKGRWSHGRYDQQQAPRAEALPA